MTRKTYRILAKEIGQILAQYGSSDSATLLVNAFCDAMKSDNSAFDRTRFVEAINESREATIKRWDDNALQTLTDSIVRGNG